MNLLNFLWIASLLGSFFSNHGASNPLNLLPTPLVSGFMTTTQAAATAIAGAQSPAGVRSHFQLIGPVATARSTPTRLTFQSPNLEAKRLLSSISRFTQTDRELASLLSVVVTPSNVSIGIYEKQALSGSQRLRWRCGRLDQMEDPIGAKAPAALFQVVVNDHTVAETPTPEEAEAIAEQIRLLLQQPEFDPNQLRPTLVDGQLSVRLDDQTLFTVDEALAEALGRNSELLAIAWVNELRQAMGVEPLSMVEAQTAIHGLAQTGKTLEGIASWYGPRFHGRLTANGETYDQFGLTAAHPTLPFDTYLKVTNLKNGRSVVVRINDRGPYIGRRSLDLSRAAARCLNGESAGVMAYKATILEPGAFPQPTAPQPNAPATVAEEPQEQRVARR